ncbi:MAG: hypothetical protein ACI4T5_10515 [Prevotella sp.]
MKDLTRFIRKLETVPTEELNRSAEIIKAEAVAQAPYREGTLERSIYVMVSKDKTRPGLRAGASARSPSGYNYAGIQHENTEYEHPIKGKAHYISDPFETEVEDLKRRLREELKVTE